MGSDLKHLVVLIPAYKPEQGLIELSKTLLAEDFFEIVVVDDGSGKDCAPIFSELKEMGVTVLAHAINMGKGSALKTGFNYVATERPDAAGVVTADADGQHLVKDIKRVGEALLAQEDTIVLGSRKFAGKVPLKSRFGNTITKAVFNLVSGEKIRDTQTGLRGFPASSLKKMLSLKGSRYEYEMNVLLEASKFGLKLSEVDIDTVYINDNQSSHFNAITDSWRIYRLIIMFGGSSLFAALIDYIIFTIITLIVGTEEATLWIPVVGARVVSSLVNFTINRNVIFAKKKGGQLARHLLSYYMLAAVILGLNYLLILAFTKIGVNVYIAKVITEVLLFVVSFLVQKRVIFK